VHAPGQVLRHTLVLLGETLRPHRWLVLTFSILAELAVLGGLTALHTEDAALGIAVSFMVLTAVVAGTLAGPLVGALAALAGGAIFFTTVANFGADTSSLATGVSTAIWVLAALVSGVIAEALGEQVARREEASVALTRAQAVSQTAEHLLAVTASFHGGESLEAAADDICQTALGFFSCKSAVVLLFEGAALRTLAVAPHASTQAGAGRFSFADHPALARLVTLKRPAFYVDAPAADGLGPHITQALSSLLPGGAVVFVPVRPGEEPLALLALGWNSAEERPDDERLAVMQRFSDQAAIALLEARRAQDRSEAARLHATLEASLLPAMPVDHPALEIVTAYRPGEDRLLLGGDFYDVLPLPDGRLALIVGDVCGHGPHAAALGARLRAGWQALTLSGATAQTIMNSLEQVVAAQGRPEVFATVMLAWIDPASHSAALLSAGHPPPLLVGRTVHQVRLRPCLPLGVEKGGKHRTTTVKLPRDWTLLFYTDGLIEGRAALGSPERYGEQRLIRRLQQDSGGRFDAARLEDVLGEIEAVNGAAFSDDVAVVAVSEHRGRDDPHAPGRRRGSPVSQTCR
jgi:serine phosphatase RsbU (regulator of sigma subunit)